MNAAFSETVSKLLPALANFHKIPLNALNIQRTLGIQNISLHFQKKSKTEFMYKNNMPTNRNEFIPNS